MKNKIKLFILVWITPMIMCLMTHLFFIIIGHSFPPIIYLIISAFMLIAFGLAHVLIYIIDNYFD